jgi:hypothetical protein
MEGAVMDPQACLAIFLRACAAGDRDMMRASALDYNGWLDRGGFPAKHGGANVWRCYLSGGGSLSCGATIREPRFIVDAVPHTDADVATDPMA